jgi:hypothetical protein
MHLLVTYLFYSDDNETYRYESIDKLSELSDEETEDPEDPNYVLNSSHPNHRLNSSDPNHRSNSSPVSSDDFCIVDNDDTDINKSK